MSEIKHYKGTLTKVEKLENETLEEQCKRILNYKDLESYYDSYQEMLIDENDEQYIIHKDTLYKVEERKEIYNDIFNAEKIDDNKISFEVKYYNGGCGFSEAMDEALNKINK